MSYKNSTSRVDADLVCLSVLIFLSAWPFLLMVLNAILSASFIL
jgi:hypothetical protein